MLDTSRFGFVDQFGSVNHLGLDRFWLIGPILPIDRPNYQTSASITFKKTPPFGELTIRIEEKTISTLEMFTIPLRILEIPFLKLNIQLL